jgi:hypothetical protein
MKIIIGTIILSLSSIALATGTTEPDPTQEQDQRQYQDQEQYQGQYQDQNVQTDLSQANAQNVTFTSPDDITVRNTVSARVPNLVATAPCFYSWSGGVGGAGFNIGGGKAARDEECDKRELARMIHGFGYTGMAMVVACQTEAAINAIGELCAGMVTATDMVTQLTAENDRLRQQIQKTKLDCTESNNRVFEACQESK